ncbi:MAG TPA: hypothetical protein VJ724_09280 [Tahibacter sp.]|nr:hypothetical protein [Tahibacter sp.]
MKHQPAKPKPADPAARREALAHALPVAAAQAFAFVCALFDTLDYFDYQLLVVVELLLVQLSIALTTAPNDILERFKQLALTAFVVAPAVLFFNAVLVQVALAPHGGNGAPPLDIVGSTLDHLTGDGLRYALGYLALGFGVAMLRACRDARPLEWWHRHVVSQSSIETAAFVLGTFALAPVVIARQTIHWVGALESTTIGIVMIAIMIAMRLAFTLIWNTMVRRGELNPLSELRTTPRQKRRSRRRNRAA